MNRFVYRLPINNFLVILVLVHSLLTFISCGAHQDAPREGLKQPIPQETIVCDTFFEQTASALKPFHSSLIPMVRVEGGSFAFGEGEDNQQTDEHRSDYVPLPSFYISKYEVTQAQWKQVMDTNPSEFEGDSLPVDHVSWLEAVEFCNLLSAREGLTPAYRISPGRVSCNFQAEGYRLPTEAEWEFAARGGNKSQAYAYSGGNDLGQVAWWLENSDRKSHPVGQKQSNELGLHDMSGNVWEWCWEWYDSDHSSHAIRGGSWYSFPVYDHDDCLVQSRYQYYEPETWEACIPVGIRVCRSQ